MKQKFIEPLLTEDDNRFVMFPISDNDVWNMYKKAEDCFWSNSADEPEERRFIYKGG